jgi:hypothetical protein
MTAAARIRELGDLLAVGVQRLLAKNIKQDRGSKNSRDRLDDRADSEASCRACTETTA